jgi:tetratricopeptide (TPR) repeat protein
MEITPPAAQGQRSFTSFFLHVGLGRIELIQGNIDSARSHLKEMEALLPKIRNPQKYHGYSQLLGEILLVEKSYDDAISALKNVTLMKMPWIWNTQPILSFNLNYTKALLAKAYEEKGDLDKAIEILERLTDPNPENREGRLIYPKNYYYLAELYEIKGRKAKAIGLYEKFLELWKDADSGLQEVEDAKMRLAGLKSR